MSSTTAPASGLMFDPAMQSFLVDEVLPGTGIGPDRFFDGLAEAVERFAPRNAELLAYRDELQARLDRWYDEHAGPGDPVAYRAFLEEIGYLETEPSPFTISTSDVDDEIASICGPQLVVPVTNARYALNAANARWGSLYDALYGTDALGDPAPAGAYDPERGAHVVAWVRSFLDDVVPLDGASHADTTRYTVEAGRLVAWTDGDTRAGLADPEQLAGYVGSTISPTSVLLLDHGLHIELRFDPHHPVGATDRAGIADVIVEAAVTTIVDFEDSVACVDAEDKVGAYRNWLGLIRGDLAARLERGGQTIVRTLAPNRTFTTPRGEVRTLRGRSLLLARVVGHLMTTPAVHAASGPIPEGILDAFVIAAIAMHDRVRPEELRNSRHGSVYLVKPKMHGPAEVAYACEVLAAVEATLDLPSKTLKIGIMDEERRTTLNLEACIREAADRVVFINTGFLDRTGDEIHTSMRAGPVVRKHDMRSTAVDPRLRGRQRRRRPSVRVRRAGPDRQGHVGGPRSHGRAAAGEDRTPPRRCELRLGAVAHRRRAPRHPLPPRRREGPPAAARGYTAVQRRRPARDPRRRSDIDGRGGPTRARQQRAGDPRLHRSVGRRRHRLLEGP